jgi:hypothetical protein
MNHETRTHLSLEKDPPEPGAVPEPASGEVRAIPQVGGLHHAMNADRRNQTKDREAI